MEVQVNYDYREDDVRGLFDVEALVELVARREGMPETTEVSVTFATDEEVWRLNREFRGIDRTTDVLSFECDGCEDGFGAGGMPDGVPFELGDIVIAVDVAQRQAPEYGMAFCDEVSLLATHGLLHLCGYDHRDEEEAQVMEARERELLSEFWGRPFKRHAFDR